RCARARGGAPAPAGRTSRARGRTATRTRRSAPRPWRECREPGRAPPDGRPAYSVDGAVAPAAVAPDPASPRARDPPRGTGVRRRHGPGPRRRPLRPADGHAAGSPLAGGRARLGAPATWPARGGQRLLLHGRGAADRPRRRALRAVAACVPARLG